MLIQTPQWPTDVQTVRRVAALLDIPEFKVFELAHAWWFGRPAPAPHLEADFRTYMYGDRAPFWVRHYSRHVRGLHRAGTLKREALGLAARPVPRHARMRFVLALGFLILMLILLFWLAAGSSGLLNIVENCYFPPCY